MANAHKNKTLATLLAAATGATGAHRFYLRGARDPWGWLHAAGLFTSVLGLAFVASTGPVVSTALKIPLFASMLAGALEALILGLTSDEKWDAKYNPQSGQSSTSTWPLALILVLTLAIGMFGLILAISRGIDLFITGGSYG